MNYSQVGIANVALGRIGARGQIVSINENSPNAIKVLAVWDSVFQEVLSERDWKFAKTRTQLSLASGASLVGSIAATILTVTQVGCGTIQTGQTLIGSGVPNSTTILGQLSGTTGGIGTYSLSTSSTVASQPMTSGANPVYAYKHAWVLPTDLLRFVRPHKRPHRRSTWWWGWGPEGTGWYDRSDPPFLPYVAYVIEMVQNGFDGEGNPIYIKCALTDYGGNYGPACINYIRLITDLTTLTPGFVNCLTYRLAQELAINITEDRAKFKDMEEMYRDSLQSAEAQNECLDMVSEDEAGSTSWEDAGRCVRPW